MDTSHWAEILSLAMWSWTYILSAHSRETETLCPVDISEHKYKNGSICEGIFPCPLHLGDEALSQLTCPVTAADTPIHFTCRGLCPDRITHFTGVCLNVETKWRHSLEEYCTPDKVSESKYGSKTAVYIGIGVGGTVVIIFVVLILTKICGKLPTNTSRQIHLRGALRKTIMESVRDDRATRMNTTPVSRDTTEALPPSYEEAIRQKDIGDTTV